MILEHVGKSLDEAVAADPWCQRNGVTRGAIYLLYWAASLFQRPSQKLPYLFFYGPEDTGKGSFHNALGLLMSKGHVEARNALLTPHNGELDGAVLAYIEEIDLTGRNKDASSRLKDFVTSDNVWINPKYVNPYKSVSHLHWIQVSNFREFCPIFTDDTRIVVIDVPQKPPMADDFGWEPVMKPALKREASDFLRTLFDIELPVGVGRLWLPVLSTAAKREAAAARIEEERDKKKRFDPKALASALHNHLWTTVDWATYKGLVADLLKGIGEGPWSDDPRQFGKQLRQVVDAGLRYGLKGVFDDTKRGSEVTYEQEWDVDSIDPEDEQWPDEPIGSQVPLDALSLPPDLTDRQPVL